jgi:hypothetical protein
MKLLDLVNFFPLFFSNELNVKCIVGFGGFVKILMDPLASNGRNQL